MSKDVTIAIPIWNVEQYVAEAVESAARQTYKDIQLLIVDDCGTDRSMEIAINKIVELGVADRTKILQHDKNRGLGIARNSAIANTTTEYLYFLDSDDEMQPDAIEKLMAAAQDTNADITLGSCQKTNADKTKSRAYSVYPKMVITTPQAGIYLTAYAAPRITTEAWGKLYKTSLFHDHNIRTCHLILEDILLWMETAYYAATVATIPDIVQTYRVRPKSICRTGWNTPARQELLQKLKEEIDEFAEQHPCMGMNEVRDRMKRIVDAKIAK
ncbi:MAG: glycosyltransferase family 2 protein [Alphaproteobacteria bacterium]|nr:glycosyltransferase family 2 protein [Alphaproteobacteria bacterium]